MEEHNGIAALPLPNVVTPDGLWPELAVNGVERIHNNAVSPDGKRVAFYRDRNAHSDLFTVELDSSATPNWPNRLTFERTHVNWWEDEPPAWTPDSRYLIFGAYDEGVSNLYVVPVEGGRPRQLTELNDDVAEPVASPDGKLIAFSTYKDDVSQIAIVPFDGGWVMGLTHDSDECASPAWMPDGSRIIYQASPQHQIKQTGIYSISPTGGAPTRLTPGDGAQYWAPGVAPDGSCIALLCNRSGNDEVWLMAADGSRLTQLTHIGQDVEDYAWAADGKRIVLIGSEQGNDPLYVVTIDDCKTIQLRRPAGNHSTPRWVPGRNAFVVGFDNPSQPPDLYLCDGMASAGDAIALTNSAPSALRNFPFVTPSHTQFTSNDGWLIPGFLYLPHSFAEQAGANRPKRGYPGIVYPHGGPTAQYDLTWDPIRQYFVAKGYVILCPNFRGSTGYGRHFKEGNLFNWGVGDLKDCLAAADVFAAMQGVDAKRLAIWGQSYGGYLALLALTKDPQYRFRCGVCLYGDSHLKTSWALGDHSGRQDVEWQMGLPSEHAAEYEIGSPLNFVKDIRAPVLIIHGERDARVHPSESARFVEALKRENKHYEYKTYPDEGHGFANSINALDALRHIERFLDWHLM